MESLSLALQRRFERKLASIVIQAQEQERARIGRELHDDITQQLSLMVCELELLENDSSDVKKRLRELQERLIAVGRDVQTLSHALHPSIIERLGIVGGIESWCREFAGKHGIRIDFSSHLSSAPPHEIGICLFRVLQEALNNAVKHSRAKQIKVELAARSDDVYLTVSDSGIGFDTKTAKGRGLGLSSMEERVSLVGGSIAIDSKPTGGTRIRVRVPLNSQAILGRTGS